MSGRPSRRPLALLGMMTAFTIGGPIGIGAVLRGGASPDWPPDRPVEWLVVLGVSGLVLALMLACLSLALANRRSTRSAAGGPEAPPEARP